MKKFKLIADVTISVYTEVEAETLEEAIQIAEDRHIEAAEYYQSITSDAWTSDGYDVAPMNIRELPFKSA